MKHNWEYMKIDELGVIKSGYTPSSDELASHGDYPYFKVAEMNLPGNEKYLMYSSLYLSGEVKTFPANSIVFPKNGAAVSTNKKRILQVDSVVDLNTAVMIANQNISVHYLCYILINIDFANLVKRGAVPTLNILELKNKIVPVPPMEVQQQIVAELDKINEVIEDCRELLRNLDVLARSLFYDFFGDPISNPKGFKLKKLGEIDEISSAKRVLVKDVVDKGIPFIRGTELACLSKQNSFDPSIFTMFITPEHYERVKSITGVPKPHDLLIPSINADGYIWEINTTEPLYFKDGRVLWVHVNHGVHSSKWLKFALSKIIKEKYANLSRGAVFAELTLVFLRNLDIIVPPLSLQEKFAARIEQIEAQKKTVEQTITNLQVLLDSRMDYWFN